MVVQGPGKPKVGTAKSVRSSGEGKIHGYTKIHHQALGGSPLPPPHHHTPKCGVHWRPRQKSPGEMGFHSVHRPDR